MSDGEQEVVRAPGTEIALRPRRGPLGLVRGAGRRVLRVFRPVAAPFLHRLELRMERAVGRTGVVDGVQGVAARTDALAEGTERAFAALSEQLHRQSLRMDALEAHLTRMAQDDARAAARVETLAAELVKEVAAQTAPLDVRLDGLTRTTLGASAAAERMTALVADQAARLDRLVAVLQEEAGHTSLAERLPDGVTRLEHGMTALHQKSDAMARQLAAVANRNVIGLPDGSYAVRTPQGYVVVPRDDIVLLVYLAEGGGHEAGTVRALEALVRPGDHVIDVGAHIGLMAVPLGRRVGADGSVLALEPSPLTADCLRRTLRLNGLSDRVQVVEKAASGVTGPVVFHVGHNTSLNSLLDDDPAARAVELDGVRLDDLVPPGTRVDVVKIDVEGAELQVLAGMGRVIADNPDLVVVVEFAMSHLVRTATSAATWIGRFAAAGLGVVLAVDETDGRCTPVSVETLAASGESMNLMLARPGSGRAARQVPPEPIAGETAVRPAV